MTTQEIIKMLISIRNDADRLHSGNVAHQRTHIIGDLQWLIDELSKANGANTRTEPALPIQSVMASVSDELLLRAGKYEDEANADFDTNGVQHNLNVGRYDGLMQAVQELNKHLP